MVKVAMILFRNYIYCWVVCRFLVGVLILTIAVSFPVKVEIQAL